ncbi:MAG: MotA/TolQ/ExbB proton channel family protein [Planctomycetes bacterium]|nr:MotA/TolQ/ExbB proton channel family protein [Planctomycetota bacterium]
MLESTLGITMAIFAQASGAAEAVADVPEAVQIQSLWDFITKGGIVMIPIGLCSFVALAVFVERLISLRRSVVIPATFLPGLKKMLRTNPNDKAKAIAYCRKNASPVANVFAAGIKKLDGSIESIQQRIEDAGQREVLKLRRFLRVLSVIASVTPLMGLLGTIFGMIKAFQTVAVSPDALGKTELLATGIYEAMITTAAGLTVAIPVLIAYHWISAKIDRLVMDIDEMSVEFLEELGDGGFEAAPDEGPEVVAETAEPQISESGAPVAAT